MAKMNKSVLVAMSGGVDSSVAAFLLKNEGYKATGVFLNFWKEKNRENRCCSIASKANARKVAKQLGINFLVLDFAQIFKKTVVDDYINQQLAGKTPNPCVQCNKFVKLGHLLNKAKDLGFDYVATGHYLQIKRQKNSWHVYKALDKSKDQSYFLYNLTQSKLDHLLFPLGRYRKTKVREMAKKAGLKVYNQPDSQDLCFIPDDNVVGFLERNCQKIKVGQIIDNQGKIVGTHRGLPFYTIGQRAGLGLGGQAGPYYVIAKKVKQNRLIVTNDKKSNQLWQSSLGIKEINWISKKKQKFPQKVTAKIRYLTKPEQAVIKKVKNQILVQFNKPIRAITPGQSVVFYKNEELLGGGIIT